MRAISNARVRIFSAEGSLLAEVWDPVYDFTIYYGIAVVKSMGRGGFFWKYVHLFLLPWGILSKLTPAETSKCTDSGGAGGLFTRECAGRALNNHNNGKRIPA